MSVLVTRPSLLGTNMPATTTTPASPAIDRTADAHGPSSGSATGASGTPNRHIVASGNTTSAAPASAARAVSSATSFRLAAGSVPARIWASAMRMRRAYGPRATQPAVNASSASNSSVMLDRIRSSSLPPMNGM